MDLKKEEDSLGQTQQDDWKVIFCVHWACESQKGLETGSVLDKEIQ